MNALKVYSAPSHIHALAARIPLEDSEYRDMLYDLYGKRSSKALTPLQQTEFIKILKKQLRKKNGGKWGEFKRSNPKMATPAQLRAVEVMWKDVSRTETIEARERALLAFCKRITGIERLEWLTKRDVRMLIKAMEKMGANTPEHFNITAKTQGG